MESIFKRKTNWQTDGLRLDYLHNDVQSFWHEFEIMLIKIVDSLCPLEKLTLNAFKQKPPQDMKKNLINVKTF